MADGWTRVEEASGWTPVAEEPRKAIPLDARGRPVVSSNLSDNPEPDWKANLAEAMQGSAHPQTLGDVTGLLIPGQVEGALRTVGRYATAVKQGVAKAQQPTGIGSLLTLPARVAMRSYQALSDSLPTNMAKAVEEFHGGPPLSSVPAASPRITTGGTPDLWDSALQEARTARTTPPTAAPAPAPTGGLSAAERASLAKQGYAPEVIAKIEAQAGTPAPMASHAPAAPAQPELQGPRIRTGAERVGRQVGMSKEEVRQAAGPVLDEAVGDASPILPEDALKNIVDKMKSLPRGGPEREAYVQAATSGKTKWQVENIRRTLEHLGFLAPPVAIGGRAALLQLMRSHEPTTETP